MAARKRVNMAKLKKHAPSARSKRPVKTGSAKTRPTKSGVDSAAVRAMENWLHGNFRTLAELLPERLMFKDRESRFLWANRAALIILGARDLAEVCGKTDHDFFQVDHAEHARADELEVLTTGVPILDRVEEDYDRHGNKHWIQTTRIPLRDRRQHIVGLFVMVRDLTDLKQVQESYERESSFLRALLDNMPDAVYFKDTQSRFLRVSSFIHLEGMKSPEEVIGKTDFDYFTHDHAQEAFDDEQRIIATQRPLIDKIERETYPNKPDTWVSTTKVPIFDKNGEVTGIVGISRDVTERFKAEEAVRKAKEELEVRVQERTAALMEEIKQHLRTEKALREGERKLQESNARLGTRVEQLNFLNATAHQLTHFISRGDLLPAIVTAFSQSRPGVEVALLELIDGDFKVQACTPGLSAGSGKIHCASLATVLHDGKNEAQLVPDLRADPRLASLALPEYIACLQIPLCVEDRAVAQIQIFGDLEFALWYAQENVVIQTLAAQAAVSLSNANNFLSLEARARVESELAVAQNIQKRFTPVHNPAIPRVSMKGVYFPAYEVGGDYLDYFRTDRGDWVIVIADVSGKGIPAALVMTMLRSTIRAEARYEKTAKRLLCSVNDMMAKDLDDRSFITASCLVINAEGTHMTYARAGHPPLLVRHAHNGRQPIPLSPRGLALGMADSGVFADLLEEIDVPLQAGDAFVLYTDGLTEAMNPERSMYGTRRLQSLLAREASVSPEILVRHILDDVRDFTRNAPSHDDLTMLVFEVEK